MRIVETRFLRGPNLFARRKVLFAIVDLEHLDEVESSDIDGFTDRLVSMLPGVREHHCGVGYRGGFVDRLREGTYMGHIAEHVMLELQSLAGDDVRYGNTRMIPGRPRHYRIVAGYEVEAVALRALEMAVDLVRAAANGRVRDTGLLVAELRTLRARHGLGPSTQAIVDAARERGIPVMRLTDDASLLQLGWGARQRRVQAALTGHTSHIAVEIAGDKQLTKQLLEAGGIPVPPGRPAGTLATARAAAEAIGWPVTVKPLDGNQGRGVTTGVASMEQLVAAFDRAREQGARVLVERHVEGDDHRVLVVQGRVVAASRRLPAQVTGDGRRTVRQLVDALNVDPRRGEGHEAPLTRVRLDAAVIDCLAAQGRHPDQVPPAGAAVRLRTNANLSTGGTAEDVTGRLHPQTAALCVRAARRVGLDVAGIDLVCRDIGRPLHEQGGAVIEVNAAPGLRMHEQPSAGEARRAGRAIVDGLFGPDDDGRIPLIAVTGTNGKTTTTLAIAHVLRAQGLRTGCTTTEGVFVDGQTLMEGDCTGYHSGRAVLTDPDVDVAVLETARGGILKRGLCFDRSDVAVVLNVSDDHLGQDGIDSIEELARVKAVVADTARRAAVLNAEDPHCVAMAGELREGVEVVWFSMDPGHEVVRRHRESGGRAVLLRDGEIVLAEGDGERPVLRADRLAFALHGRARHNVANALAATAALLAAGVAPVAVAAALPAFQASVADNPLRLNLFQLGELRLLVDYAHNRAAYEALIDTCRSLDAGRRIAVVSAPGDRRDAELQALARCCAEGFDELVIYEIDEDRGRPRGETAQVLASGAAPAGRPLQVVPDLREALRAGRDRCGPGDLLVYACATSLQDLADAFGSLPSPLEERHARGLRLAWSADPAPPPAAVPDERPHEAAGAAARRRHESA